MTLACTITSTGITAPSFEDVLAYLKNVYATIYGADVYLDDDSQDGQFITILAKLIKDNNDATVAVYNAFSPLTAQGVGLSSVVKINGIQRLVASNSQAIVAIGGTVGTQIFNGVISDQFGTKWNLPALVTIPFGGTINVTATAQDPGAVIAAANTLTKIVTPTRGWQTVDNTVAGTPGDPVESDAALRQRQSVSVAIPALSVLGAILGAIKNIVGVGRATLYDNDTGAADGNGVPAHSIAAVVEGGDAGQVAAAIARYKTPGTGTYGTTSIVVFDPAGIPSTINFFSLTLVEVSVLVNIHALTGFVVTTATAIQTAVAAYLTALDIGQDSFLNRLWSPVNLSGDAATTATGQTQAQLDVLSDTYEPLSIYQARADMSVVAGPYGAGVHVINVTNTANYTSGDKVAIKLDDGSILFTTVNGAPAGTAVTLLAAIPIGRSILNGALLYDSVDLVIAYTEAARTLIADVLVNEV